MAEKAGWYPDPGERPDVYRWWTGQGWTKWLADSDDGPPPVGHDDPRITAVVVPRGDRQVSHTARTIAIALLLVLVVLGLAAAGGAAANRAITHPDWAPTPSNYTDTPPMADATFTVDQETREVSFGDVSVTLPPGMYSEAGLYLGFDPVHITEQHVPQSGNDGWVAVTGLGLYTGPVQVDSESYAIYLLGLIAEAFFGENARAEIRNVQPSDLGDLPADRTVGLTAELHVEVAGVDATFDWVEVIVIEVNQAQRAVWISAIPNNASDQVIANVAASRETLRVN